MIRLHPISLGGFFFKKENIFAVIHPLSYSDILICAVWAEIKSVERL